MDVELQEVSNLSRLSRRRRSAANNTDAQRDDAIRRAIERGAKVKDLVQATGLSRERIYQIRDHSR